MMDLASETVVSVIGNDTENPIKKSERIENQGHPDKKKKKARQTNEIK